MTSTDTTTGRPTGTSRNPGGKTIDVGRPEDASGGGMTNLLLASVPIFGHVSPMISLARELVERGHRVDLLTGERFRRSVEAVGARFVPLPAEADFDDRTMNDGVSASVRPGGIAGLRYDVSHVFLAPARAQHQALLSLIDDSSDDSGNTVFDAVVVDPAFVGAALLAATPAGARPPVVVAGVLPLPLDSVDTPPFGLGLPPSSRPSGPWNRIRNRTLSHLVQHVVFGSVQHDYDRLFRKVTGTPAPSFVTSWFSKVDHIVQLTVPSFEYPRSDASVPIAFAGPIIRRSHADIPGWLRDLDPQRPVALVTQGTIANRDLGELVRPTITALAGAGMSVIVTTGRPVEERDGLDHLPAHVHVVDFVPYDAVFPHIDVFVTNGGYGGVQLALAHAVPVVVAGSGEDKPEVAARVAWSGVGLNLKTGRPRPAAVRRAVERVLADPAYRAAATKAAHQVRGTDPTNALLAAVAEAANVRRHE